MLKEILKDEYHILNTLVWIKAIIWFAIWWIIALFFLKEMTLMELQKTRIELEQCQKIIEKITK